MRARSRSPAIDCHESRSKPEPVIEQLTLSDWRRTVPSDRRPLGLRTKGGETRAPRDVRTPRRHTPCVRVVAAQGRHPIVVEDDGVFPPKHDLANRGEPSHMRPGSRAVRADSPVCKRGARWLRPGAGAADSCGGRDVRRRLAQFLAGAFSKTVCGVSPGR